MKETWAETELMSFPTVLEANPDTFIRSEKQNLVGVKVFRNHLPYALSGQVSVLFMRPDGTSFEFNQNGSISGNRMSISLPDTCYEQDGRIGIALILTDGTQRTTLALIRGTVYPTRI